MRSIVKKAFMAVTGLGLFVFLITHLAGNLFIYAGPAAFNGYAEMLEHNPLIVPAEIGLIIIFLWHIYLAIKLTIENKAARPVGYQHRNTAGESTLASRTMIYTGIVIFIFVILHVAAFKFGMKKIPLDNRFGQPGERMALWELVIDTFQNPMVVAWYVLAMILLGFHISHGASSALQSLGIIKSNWRGPSRWIGALIGWAIAIGFALMPIYAYIVKPKPPVFINAPGSQHIGEAHMAPNMSTAQSGDTVALQPRGLNEKSGDADEKAGHPK